MNRFQRSWLLFKSSFAVMTANRKLLIFPVVITIFTLLTAFVFLMPVAFQPTGQSYTSGGHWLKVADRFYDVDAFKAANETSSGTRRVARSHNADIQYIRPLGVAYFAVIYLASMFCATFFNVAFYSEILKALRGEPVSIRAGIRFAATKWRSILLWTLFAGAVGFVIKSLEQRFGLFGRIVLRILGTAWSVACVFVIPVLIKEEETVNPFSMLKKSALTLKQTWGESLIGYAGVSFGGLIILLFSLLWLGLGIAAAIVLKAPLLIAVMVALWLVMICAVGYLMSIASQIFRCALFVYATEGALPQPYTSEMVALAWKMKKVKSNG